MKRAVLIFAKRYNPTAIQARDELAEWIRKQSWQVIDVTSTMTPIPARTLSRVALGVVIGGDGTFLKLVRRLEKKDLFPLMGVNLGTLGFITDVGPGELLSSAGDALAGRFQEEPRALLEVELWRQAKRVATTTVFNDAVLTKGAEPSLVKMDVYLDGELLSHVRADGYIVATATGSTAYNLSAGGALVHPRTDAMALVPICPHSLSARPVVVPGNAVIELKLQEFSGVVRLVYDGQTSVRLHKGDRVRIRKAGVFLRLIRQPKQTWPEALRTKLQMA